MKASKLIMAMIIVATIGFLVWAHFAAYRVEDKPGWTADTITSHPPYGT